jgi:hypothetical protein
VVIIEDTTGRRLLQGTKKGGMYQLDCHLLSTAGGTPQAFANAATTTELWHRRLGHVAEREVAKLVKNDVVTGMGAVKEATSEGHCDVCLKAKQTRASFPRSSSQARKPVELVHTDVGPFSVDGIYMGGARPDDHDVCENMRWVVTLMDDYTRYAEAIPLPSNGLVAGTVVDYLKLWERQTDQKVKRIRSDQGKEYLGELRGYCRDNGIRVEVSVAYT